MSLSLNRLEDNEYEGMDILNDVLKYGSSDTPQDMGGYHDYKDFILIRSTCRWLIK